MSCVQTYTWCTTGHKLGKWQRFTLYIPFDILIYLKTCLMVAAFFSLFKEAFCMDALVLIIMLILIICLIGTLYSLYISTLNFINRFLFMNSAFCLQNSMEMRPSEVSCGVWCWFVGLYGSCVDPADPQKQNMEVWRLHQCLWSFLMLFKQFFSRLCAFAEIIGW